MLLQGFKLVFKFTETVIHSQLGCIVYLVYHISPPAKGLEIQHFICCEQFVLFYGPYDRRVECACCCSTPVLARTGGHGHGGEGATVRARNGAAALDP